MWITSPPSNQMRLRGRGFTLAEALIASVVLAVAVVGIMGPLSATYQQSRNQDESRIAVSLGRQLLEEIVSKPFVDPSDFSTTLGPEADESGRSAFDNVDDYNGYHDSTDSSATDFIKRLDGSSLPWTGNQIYRRSVAVEYRTTPSGSATASGNFVMVTVTVTGPSGQTYVARRLAARYPRFN